jgi:hypothetical protein
MSFVAPFPLLKDWLDKHAMEGTDIIICTFDDLVDVLRGIVIGVPVDEAFYTDAYPAVAKGLIAMGLETPQSHYYKHGYFEGRSPFETGWKHLTRPVAFAEITAMVRPIPRCGWLDVKFGRRQMMETISELLRSVSVNESWYLATYPAAAKAIRDGRYISASDHYRHVGYFDAYLPQSVVIDEAWYIARYQHVRNGLAAGVATSAQDHFIRIGYPEGCRPVPP